MVSRNCNPNFPNINHIFLKKQVNFSSFEGKINDIYIKFDHSYNSKVLHSYTMCQNTPYAAFKAQTIHQNLRQIEWLGPL